MLGLYSGKMDRMGATEEPWPPFRRACSSSPGRGSFAMEFRSDRPLFSRTRVWASEKAVPHRGGGSTAVATGAGRCIIGSVANLLSDDGEVLALGADSGATAVVTTVAGSAFFPDRMDMLRSSGVRLPVRDGESRDTESIDGRRPAAAFIWFLDGGLSLGKREKDPP